jgi:hypothetical protein
MVKFHGTEITHRKRISKNGATKKAQLAINEPGKPVVKIAKTRQKPALRDPLSLDMITGSTYIGHSEILSAILFIDNDWPATVLVRFAGKKPFSLPWEEFVELVRCLKFFRQKVSQVLSEKSTALPRLALGNDFSLAFLETRRIQMRWKDNIRVFSIIQFGLVVDVFGGCYVKARPIADRIEEKKKLLEQPSLLGKLSSHGGFIVFFMLTMLNILIFVSMFFQPALYLPWTGLTVFQALWLLLLRPDWAYRVIPALIDYLNEQFLADLSNLRLPRKSIEFFLIISMGIIYLICFGSEAALYIFRFYRSIMP